MVWVEAALWGLFGSEFADLRGHNGWVQAVVWSPDGRRLATASGDETARIWNADNDRELAVLRGHRSGIWSLAWSPDSRRLATGLDDQTIRVWDAESGAEIIVEDLVANARRRVSRKLTAEERRNLMLPPIGD